MSLSISELEQIETQVLNWPPACRGDFAERLFQSLADEELAASDLSEDQIDEIVRRQQRHRNGRRD